MSDLKNLKCLLPYTETLLLKMLDGCDFLDQYVLVKTGMSLKKMFACSLEILDGITSKLFSVALLYTDDIEDDNIEYLEPMEVIRGRNTNLFRCES